MIRHHLFGAAHIDRIGTLAGPVAMGKSNPGQCVETAGGAALNVASSLAVLGAAVSLLSVVGRDGSGDHIRDTAKQRGIEFDGVPVSGSHPTATYTGLLAADGELILGLADMAIYAEASFESVLVDPEDWVLVDANLSPAAIKTVLMKPAAHRAAMTVSAAKASRLLPHLRVVDLLFTNRAEAAEVSGVPAVDPLPTIAHGLANAGCRRAVISDGANPLVVLDSGTCVEMAVAPSPVLDVTGAGDALAAGTLFALGQGVAFADAVKIGIAAARAIIGIRGPYRADLTPCIGTPS